MKKLIIATLLVAASLYLLLSAFVKDITVNQYKDLAAAKDQQAIKQGWVPGIVPASAYDIKEVHGRDAGGIFGEFRYKESDEPALVAHLVPLKDGNGTMEWGAFLFRVDTQKNLVKYRNMPETSSEGK